MKRLIVLPAVLAASAAFAQPPSVSVPQLSAPERAGAAQIDGDAGALSARSRATVNAPVQVGEGRRTAEAAPPLSSAAQGRAVATSAVGGVDRCDPTLSTSRSEACRRRVETRAGQFDAPAPAPVTSEARLLLLTQPQAPMTADTAARRLGSTGALDQAAGQAADQLAGAIAGGAGQLTPPPSTTPGTVPAGGVSALPAGVPSTVVLTPR